MEAVRDVGEATRELGPSEAVVALALSLGRALRRAGLPLRAVEPVVQVGDGRDEIVALGRFAILAMRRKRSD
jgi:hypothetical protein